MRCPPPQGGQICQFTNRAVPLVCTAWPAFAWRYPTNPPAPVSTSMPATPGTAKAATWDNPASANNPCSRSGMRTPERRRCCPRWPAAALDPPVALLSRHEVRPATPASRATRRRLQAPRPGGATMTGSVIGGIGSSAAAAPTPGTASSTDGPTVRCGGISSAEAACSAAVRDGRTAPRGTPPPPPPRCHYHLVGAARAHRAASASTAVVVGMVSSSYWSRVAGRHGVVVVALSSDWSLSSCVVVVVGRCRRLDVALVVVSVVVARQSSSSAPGRLWLSMARFCVGVRRWRCRLRRLAGFVGVT